MGSIQSLLRRQWDIKSSIVDAFATFLLLSNVIKLLFVSADILAPTRIWGRNSSTHALASYFDVRIQLSTEPKLVLKGIGILLLLLIFVFLPTTCILLLLYPRGFCQKCMNGCHLNFQALHLLAYGIVSWQHWLL